MYNKLIKLKLYNLIINFYFFKSKKENKESLKRPDTLIPEKGLPPINKYNVRNYKIFLDIGFILNLCLS